MKLNWEYIANRVVAGLIVAAILSLTGWLGAAILKSPQASMPWIIGAVSFVTLLILSWIWSPARAALQAFYIWFIDRRGWQIVLGLFLLTSMLYLGNLLWNSPFSFAYTLGLALAVILLQKNLSIRIWPMRDLYYEQMRLIKRQDIDSLPKFWTISFYSGKVANSDLGGRYACPPSGEVYYDGIEFKIESAIFDTQRMLEKFSGAVTSARISFNNLDPKYPVKNVKFAYFLINAGGGWKIDPATNLSLKGTKIGRIILGFAGAYTQETVLILGENIREWAIGNAPDRLVTSVSDPSSQVVWKGKTVDGNDAVIDLLSIEVEPQYRARDLEAITFTRDITPQSNKGQNLHYFILAASIEFDK